MEDATHKENCGQTVAPPPALRPLSSTRSSTTGSQAKPNSRMQRSMLAVPNSRPSQSARNSWIFCRDSRKRTRQHGDEAGEHRTDQAAFGQLQVAPAAFDLRAASGCGTRDRLMAAGTAADE